MTADREAVARALAAFEAADDVTLLRDALEEAAPRVKRMVGAFLRRGSEDAIPPPADLRAARQAAPLPEALTTLRQTNDFPLLQVMTRAIGRRIEALEIVASASIAVGARVRVPEGGRRSAKTAEGTVEATGTLVSVLLDNGETWEGPASQVEVLP